MGGEAALGHHEGDGLTPVVFPALMAPPRPSPAEASGADSWLCMDATTIVCAAILDRRSASQIYENIARRVRRDPRRGL
jgi:hypothetical protein